MDYIEKTLINNIKKLLYIYDYNQTDLADYLKVPRQTVSKMLLGERCISSTEVNKIANFFGVNIGILFKDNKAIRLKNKVVLFHGSTFKKIKPKFMGGNDKHDYGNGFYLSFDKELAKQWSVCSQTGNGFLHMFELDVSKLSVCYLNEDYSVLTWLAVLSKHRSADNTKRYRQNVSKLIDKYYDSNIEKYDVIVGYRADDSYFSFAKNAIKNNIDISLLEKIMMTGNLGYQIFIQSKKAFSQLKEINMNDEGYFEEVDFDEYFRKYDINDSIARDTVARLMNSEENSLEDTIERYLD